MTAELQKFINENIDLIDKNTKESWEQIYEKLPILITGEFTKTVLDSGINNPSIIMGYIPNNYLRKSNITSYKIPSNIISIGDYAFFQCSNLTNITIPDSVTSIGSWAFYRCDSLKSVEISDNVTSIDGYAFSYCKSLKEINFKGTKQQSMKLGIGNRSRKKWRENSFIGKIICTDGEIILE